MKKIFLFMALFFAIQQIHGTDPGITVPLRFDHYYDYEQLVNAIRELNKAYPGLSRLELVGKSEENREIWAIIIHNPSTGPENNKPGIYVDGNIHGNEIQAGEVCLYLANTLLTKYGENEKIKKVVDRNVFYIIPSVNVDGRYHFFKDANTPSSNRGLRRPKDDDGDGLFDEDFPDDLDGDGNICSMRIRDPNGDYKTDPSDPRLMVRIKPGEKGEFRMLGQEGIDNDNDGRINEDSEGYVDGNRNWGYHWAPDYVQRGSGDFPFSGTGIKAIADFLIEKENIAMVWAFHNSGGMILRGPSTKAEGEFPSGDLSLYDYLGKNSENIIPGYKYLVSWKDLYSTYGDFDNFTNNLLGTYGFVGELFQSETQTYGPKKPETSPQQEENRFEASLEEDREQLKFNDHVAMGELYKDWKAYKHPVYGDIEIGGWVKMSSRLPHPFMLQDLVHRNAMAVIFSAEQTPDIKMEVFEKMEVSKDLYRIRIRLINKNAMPSISYQSVKHRLYPQDLLRISGNNIKVVAGGQILDRFSDKVNYKEFKPEVQFLQVPGFGSVEFEFLVSGKGTIQIDYSSRKAGKREMEVRL